MKRKDRFDYIMIETTGLADPGPVAQTFFVDDEMKHNLSLDGIVTVVDALHIWQHLDDSQEAREPIAFADVILLNKMDLVPPADLERLEARIRSMNAVASVYRTRDAALEVDKLLHLGGFNLSHALEVDPQFLEPEYPFEWAGLYDLAAGTYTFKLWQGPDPQMDVVLLPVAAATATELDGAQMDAVLLFSEKARTVSAGGSLRPEKRLVRLRLSGRTAQFKMPIPTPGVYALFTEHLPQEFQATVQRDQELLQPVVSRLYKPDHEHNDEVSSVGINLPGDLHGERLNAWMSKLLQERGQDIFRMKGVLSIKGEAERFVFQGVHMLFSGAPDRPWGQESRQNRLIFIGRNLDRATLTRGFRACLA